MFGFGESRAVKKCGTLMLNGEILVNGITSVHGHDWIIGTKILPISARFDRICSSKSL